MILLLFYFHSAPDSNAEFYSNSTADSTLILRSQNYFKPKDGLPGPPIVVLNIEQVYEP